MPVNGCMRALPGEQKMDEPNPWKLFDQSGRVTVITGAAGLLGREYCQTIARAGGHPIVADIDGDAAASFASRMSSEYGREVLGFQTDVSNPESVQTMVDRVLDRYGKIDALVNNAAINPKFDTEHAREHTASFETFPLDEWNASLAVNVTGMFLCAQAVAPGMLAQGRGVIVNIASTYGLVGPDQRLYQREGEPTSYKPVTYTVSKAAAIGLTKYLATYYAGTGIRVNTLSPGGVFADHDDEFVRRYSAKTVLGRMAEVNEMNGALLFLVSDASSYMTGANLVVDGGWTAW